MARYLGAPYWQLQEASAADVDEVEDEYLAWKKVVKREINIVMRRTGKNESAEGKMLSIITILIENLL